MADHPFANQLPPAAPPPLLPAPGETTPDSEPLPEKPSTGNPFKNKQTKVNRSRFFLACGLTLAALLAIIFFVWLGTRGGILILEPTKDFTVTLNGVQAKLQQQNGGVFIRTAPGLYRLELSRTNYQPFDADLDIKRGQVVKIRPIFSVLPKTTHEDATSTVAFVRRSFDEKSVYYLGNDGQTIYQVTIANQVQVPITTDSLQNVQDIEWSTNPNLALIVQSDGIYLQEIPTYNFVSQIKTKVFGTDALSPVWDPNTPGRLAVAYEPPNGEKSLVFTDDHFQILNVMADIGAIHNPRLIWSPTSDAVLLIARSTNLSQNNLWVYNTINGQLHELSTGGNVVDASFSPDGGTIVYERLSGTTPQLWRIKTNGSNNRNLGISNVVSQLAWEDTSHFYLPDSASNILDLYDLDGSRQEIPFSFPPQPINGMYYYTDSKTLIFYTSNSIYLADLSK
jgi:WD40 repeat protein